MCIYVHENMWLVADTYIEDEREKWTLIITDIFIHLVSRWSPLILTVLTNQFIKNCKCNPEFFSPVWGRRCFLPTLYFVVAYRTEQLVCCEKEGTCWLQPWLVLLSWSAKDVFIGLWPSLDGEVPGPHAHSSPLPFQRENFLPKLSEGRIQVTPREGNCQLDMF
jgi:hypothetical protein